MKKIYLALLGALFIHPATFLSAEDDDAILLEDEDIKPSNVEDLIHPEKEVQRQLKKEFVEHQTKERNAFKTRHSKGKTAKNPSNRKSKKMQAHNKKFNSKHIVSRDSIKLQKGRKSRRNSKRFRGKRSR